MNEPRRQQVLETDDADEGLDLNALLDLLLTHALNDAQRVFVDAGD